MLSSALTVAGETLYPQPKSPPLLGMSLLMILQVLPIPGSGEYTQWHVRWVVVPMDLGTKMLMYPMPSNTPWLSIDFDRRTYSLLAAVRLPETRTKCPELVGRAEGMESGQESMSFL